MNVMCDMTMYVLVIVMVVVKLAVVIVIGDDGVAATSGIARMTVTYR